MFARKLDIYRWRLTLGSCFLALTKIHFKLKGKPAHYPEMLEVPEKTEGNISIQGQEWSFNYLKSYKAACGVH